MPRVLFIENHDSFSWNVIDALPWPRSEITVVHGAPQSLDGFDVVVMGPGPTDPVRAGLINVVHEVARRGLPFIGICLGHQALGLAFGATLIRSTPAHGKRAVAHFTDGRSLEVMRYHSLSLRDVRSPLKVTATLDDGTVMAIAHESLPMVGYQFHPDSFGTPEGRKLLGEGQGERKNLSSLRDAENFALLAPAYSNSKSWTLITNLRPDPTGHLIFSTAEDRPRRFSGERTSINLNVDVPLREPTVSLDDTNFITNVESIRTAIAAGDVYQVNLTLRAALSNLDGAQLLAWLCRTSTPRFAAWVRSPHLGEFVSASPELLVETSGRSIHVEPMKGTSAPDQRTWLEGSEKDKAELAMITDLLRDDLHRICIPGSVVVTNERRFIELPYVIQAVADVMGTLPEATTIDDVLNAVHPGGSVTGAPRQAALEIISRLEPKPRGAYCGALGLITTDQCRCALLIRTAQRQPDGTWLYGVGGGITWDSTPDAELAEVHLKLGALVTDQRNFHGKEPSTNTDR